jgi:2-C-methyl-D-erythritol 4-phosphate cytidylyltransferase/2-C-methyl-D-erythritol 2,4-cyclodiphosphate synthase
MKNSVKVVAIIVAGGKGIRMGGSVPKQFLSYKGKTVLECAIEPFLMCKKVEHVVIVGPKDNDKELAEIYNRLSNKYTKPISVTYGGETRQKSVKKGIDEVNLISNIESDCIVVIHDGARPNVSVEIIENNIEAAEVNGAAVTAVGATDTMRLISDYGLKRNENYPIIPSETLPRELLYNVQTPQAFKKDILEEAFAYAEKDGFIGTDDSVLVERLGVNPILTEGSYSNIKVTRKEDLPLRSLVGNGFDVHRLTGGRKLILCGVDIPYEKGLLGHSDADVALHALMDAILGAAALGDIGKHFPDTDEAYKDISSMELLRRVRDMVNCEIQNIDITIMAEKPKISLYIDEMKNNIAEALGIGQEAVNIKATTTEGLGFIGRGEGIAALATCVINK